MKILQVGSNRGNDDLFQHLNSNYDKLEFILLVEANSLHIEELKKCYSKYKNLLVENIAIKPSSHYNDQMTIYYNTNDGPGYETASCKIEHIYKHEQYYNGGEIKSFTVPCLTLEQLFDKYNIQHLDWLLLDIEGIDAEIILDFDWKKYQIKQVEIEHLHLGENAQVIEKMFFDMGYSRTNSLHFYDWSFIRN
jgi:FkbM family methyltransferase